jgi:DNA-binding MarR family transcriptional regulator
MPDALSYDLHKLVARLDVAADQLLRREVGTSYSRFLALFAVRETGGSQRDLARWLGLTEPSASRMVRILVSDGLLSAVRTAGGGNRRKLQLTEEGARLVQTCAEMLEGWFAELVERSDVPFATYQRHTRRLLTQLDNDQHGAANEGRTS